MTERDPRSVSRRTYVKSAGLAGAAGLVGLAGCTGNNNGNSGNDSGTSNGGSGNSSSGGGNSGGSGKQLVVLHGWTGGDGKSAITALTKEFAKKYPDMNTDFRPIGGGGNTNLDTVVAKRLGNNNPPSSFDTWPGANLQKYDGVMGDIGSVWDEIKPQYYDVAAKLSKHNGKYVTVPIGSHRLNDLFYNVKVVKKAGVDPSSLESVDDLINAMKQVQQKTDAVPMAQGMKLPWPTLQLFAQTLLSTAGYQAYMDFTNGKGDKAKVTTALKKTKTILSNYINDDASSIGFTSANQMIMNGKAAFIHQGNWVAGAYKSNNFEYKKDWNAVTYPGTKGMYTLHMDSFIYPKNNPSPKNTKTWLKFVGSPKPQATFNSRKGSIPLRKDAPTDQFGEYLKNTIEDFKSAKKRPPTITHGLAVPPKTLTRFKGIISDNFSGPYNVDATASALIQASKQQS